MPKTSTTGTMERAPRGTARPNNAARRRPRATGLAAVAAVALLALTVALPPAAAASTVRAQVCREAVAADAVARGWATVLAVHSPILDFEVPSTPTTSEQRGPGYAQDSGGVVLQVPDDGSIARVGVFETSSQSEVTDNPVRAFQRTNATVADVSLLDGLVQARVLRAQSMATATGSMADVNGRRSTHVDVVVDGILYTNIGPNTRIALPDDLGFGTGSSVTLFERADIGLFPDDTRPFYVADQLTRMIHVRLGDFDPTTEGDQPLEIIVAEAHSYAQAPSPFCGGAQSVAANAYVARLMPVDEPLVSVGWVKIPATGGQSNQSLLDVEAPMGGELLGAHVSTSLAEGKLSLGESSVAFAKARLADVCVARASDNDTDCLVSAGLIWVESHSYADANTAYSWSASQVVGLKVAGIDVCEALGLQDACSPPPNTVIEIGPYTVYLNERIWQGGPGECRGHTGHTVREVRVVGPIIGTLVLGQAHTEATYC